MSHLDKYGKFLTRSLRGQLGVPFTPDSLSPKERVLAERIGYDKFDDHVIVTALVFQHCMADPRRELFIDLFQVVQDVSLKINKEIGLGDNNSMVIARSGQMCREYIGLADKITEKFVDHLHDKYHWTTNYLNAGKLSQYHPFVQFLYLVEAQEAAIAKLEAELPTVPAEEIDVPAN